jgi:hypothetical protein
MPDQVGHDVQERLVYIELLIVPVLILLLRFIVVTNEASDPYWETYVVQI